VIPSTGGRSAILLDGWQYEQIAAAMEESPKPGDEAWVLADWQVAWSPDGKLLASPVIHIKIPPPSSGADHRGVEEDLAVVYKASGSKCASFPLPKDIRSTGAFCWSRGSRKFAAAFNPVDPRGERQRPYILVFDLLFGSVQTLLPQVGEPAGVEVDGWGVKDESVLYRAYREEGTQLRAISLDGQSDRVVIEDYRPRRRSPDRSFRLATKAPEGTIAIENCLTGEVVNIAKGSRLGFLCWAPNSRIFLYRRQGSIRDETGKRSKTLNTLWLATPETHKLNHMCVALDSDESGEGLLPTWSTDSMKMAYIWRGRAYVAELARRAPSASEKVAAGMPLTEEE